MKTFQKGVFVEGAQKAERLLDGTSIKEAIENTKNIPELTQTNRVEIFNACPPILKYNDGIYYLYNKDHYHSYYCYSGEENYVIWFDLIKKGEEVIIDGNEFSLARSSEVGTVLYRHKGDIVNLIHPDGYFKVVYDIVSISANIIDSYLEFINIIDKAIDINFVLDPNGNSNFDRLVFVKQDIDLLGNKSLYTIVVLNVTNNAIETTTLFNEVNQDNTTVYNDTVTPL